MRAFGVVGGARAAVRRAGGGVEGRRAALQRQLTRFAAPNPHPGRGTYTRECEVPRDVWSSFTPSCQRGWSHFERRGPAARAYSSFIQSLPLKTAILDTSTLR